MLTSVRFTTVAGRKITIRTVGSHQSSRIAIWLLDHDQSICRVDCQEQHGPGRPSIRCRYQR